MGTVLCPDMHVGHYVLFLWTSLIVTPRHLCVIHVVDVSKADSPPFDFSLRIKCQYQQNVPQHYYLLDR